MPFFFSVLIIPLVWMFHNRMLDNRLNDLQERPLCLVHNDNTSFFFELPKKRIPLQSTIKTFRN